MSDDLATWLREQIEATKRAASPLILQKHSPWRADGERCENGAGVLGPDGRCVAIAIGSYAADHIAMNDPRDIVARCEAELAILDEHATKVYPGGWGVPALLEYWCATCDVPGDQPAKTWCRTVRLLACGYKHRAGYREEAWKP